MAPDMRFFQAVATVIPTLLVAIFFSAGFLAWDEKRQQRYKAAGKTLMDYVTNIVFRLLIIGTLLFFVIRGEAAALQALRINAFLEENADHAIKGIQAELFVLTLTLAIRGMGPFIHHIDEISDRWGPRKAKMALDLCAIVAFGISAAVVMWSSSIL